MSSCWTNAPSGWRDLHPRLHAPKACRLLLTYTPGSDGRDRTFSGCFKDSLRSKRRPNKLGTRGESNPRLLRHRQKCKTVTPRAPSNRAPDRCAQRESNPRSPVVPSEGIEPSSPAYQAIAQTTVLRGVWSGWRVPPSRPPVPETGALLAELHPERPAGPRAKLRTLTRGPWALSGPLFRWLESHQHRRVQSPQSCY